jgi:hypothetical protein
MPAPDTYHGRVKVYVDDLLIASQAECELPLNHGPIEATLDRQPDSAIGTLRIISGNDHWFCKGRILRLELDKAISTRCQVVGPAADSKTYTVHYLE